MKIDYNLIYQWFVDYESSNEDQKIHSIVPNFITCHHLEDVERIYLKNSNDQGEKYNDNLSDNFNKRLSLRNRKGKKIEFYFQYFQY